MIILSLVWGLSGRQKALGLSAPALAAAWQVLWVIDGDTVVVAGGERVRYLGVDAPELAHGDKPADPLGEEAARYNRGLVSGKKVRLEYEKKKHDRHGRLLAYVFLLDGTLVNEALVAAGYAHLFGQPRKLKYGVRLLAAQRRALRDGKGLWGLAVEKPEPFYVGNLRSWIFHRPGCPFAKKMSSRNRFRLPSRYQAFYQGLSPCRACRP